MVLLTEQRYLVLVTVATALMWIPYTIALIARGGLMAAMGNRDMVIDLHGWAARAKRAHLNAVENLALFAPLLLVASFSIPGNATVLLAARVYLIARLVHYGAYLAGIPVIRTLAFAIGWAATVSIALAIMS